MIIIHKGKELNFSLDYIELTDEQYREIVNKHYLVPSKEQLFDYFSNITSNMKVYNDYYFKTLMGDTVLYHSKFSLNDVRASKELLSVLYSRYLSNPKYCDDNSSLYSIIMTMVRLKGKGLVGIPYQFPVKSVIDILERYNINNKYYDISCGWGSRLLGALSSGVDYFGTDPNPLLCEQLNNVITDYKEFNKTSKSSAKIYCQGSEEFIPELENTIGVIFTSPPYFSLEDYKHGDQSYTSGMDYSVWLVDYLYATFANCYKYLIEGGHMLINIKDFNIYPLERDTVRLAERAGFNLIDTVPLNITVRNKDIDNSESCFVFKKGTKEHSVISTFNSLF